MSKETYYRDEQGVMAFGKKLGEIRLKKGYMHNFLSLVRKKHGILFSCLLFTVKPAFIVEIGN